MCMACDERDEHEKWRLHNRVEDVHAYLIRNTLERADDGSLLWWSNEGGWSDLGYAVVFTAHEKDTSSLPIGGVWVELSAEVKTLEDAVPSPLPEYAGLVNRPYLTLTVNEGKVSESTHVVVEDKDKPLTVSTYDSRGEERRHYDGSTTVSTYMSVSGTDLEGVRILFDQMNT